MNEIEKLRLNQENFEKKKLELKEELLEDIRQSKHEHKNVILEAANDILFEFHKNINLANSLHEPERTTEINEIKERMFRVLLRSSVLFKDLPEEYKSLFEKEFLELRRFS